MTRPECTCPTDLGRLARLGIEGKLPPCPMHNDPSPTTPAPSGGYASALNDPGMADTLARALNAKTERGAYFNNAGRVPDAYLPRPF